MRTIDRLSTHPAISRLRAEAGRARRALMAQHLAVRLGLIAAPLLLLSAAGYWAAGSLAPAGPRLLAQGRAFASDDLIKIFGALEAKGIAYRPVDRKVEVAADQYDQATVVLAGLRVGPRPVGELRDTPSSFMDYIQTPEERERRDRVHDEKLIERIIDGLDGVVWSLVCLQNPPRPTFGGSSRARASAFVYLECESDRPLPFKTVQAIPMILTSKVPGLGAESITVMDRKGRPYLDPSNPSVGQQTYDLVREQEVRDLVTDRLNWIEGVRIWVNLGDRVEPKPGPTAAPGRVGEPRGEATAATAVNRPAALDEPSPTPAQAPAGKAEAGRVLVYVPRSFYFRRLLTGPDRREPTQAELLQVAERTREQIERMIRPLLPPSWSLDVGMIPDPLPATLPAALPVGPDHRRLAADWGIIGAVAAGVALVMAMGSWIQASRRSSPSVSSPSVERRYREDPPDEPEPSELVRELVRRDPEVAASVLQRWATQGGPVT